MKKLVFLSLICAFILNSSKAQEHTKASEVDTLTVVEHLDELTLLWDVESIELKTYQGLRKFCRSSAYQTFNHRNA